MREIEIGSKVKKVCTSLIWLEHQIRISIVQNEESVIHDSIKPLLNLKWNESIKLQRWEIDEEDDSISKK